MLAAGCFILLAMQEPICASKTLLKDGQHPCCLNLSQRLSVDACKYKGPWQQARRW